MTWSYDSRLPSPMRTLIRDAFVAKLRPLSIAGGGWAHVLPVGFSIKSPTDDDGIADLIDELNGREPAICVSTGKLTAQDTNAPEHTIGQLTVELYFYSGHRRGLTDGRIVGDAAAAASNRNDPGLDAALELAWMYLLGVNLGLGTGIKDPRFVEEDEIINDPEKVIWYQTWRVALSRDVNQLRDSVQKLTGITTTLRPAGIVLGSDT